MKHVHVLEISSFRTKIVIESRTHTTRKTQPHSHTTNSAPPSAVSKWFDHNCCWQKRFRFAPAALDRSLAQVDTTCTDRYVVRRPDCEVEWGDNEREQRSPLPPPPSVAAVGRSAELNALSHGQTNFRLQRRRSQGRGRDVAAAVLCKIEPVLLLLLRTSWLRRTKDRRSKSPREVRILHPKVRVGKMEDLQSSHPRCFSYFRLHPFFAWPCGPGLLPRRFISVS